MKVNKIAKNIMARSQMQKKVFIREDNFAYIQIKESIFLNSFTYNYKGLLHDISDFVVQANKQLEDLKLSEITEEDISFEIQKQNGLFVFVYSNQTKITEQQKQLFRQFQWIITEQ